MKTQQNILVTGTSSGFGFLIARTLLNSGHTVFGAMRGLETKNADAAEKLKQAAGETADRLHLLDMDVTTAATVNAAVQRALDLYGRIDAVVNNAGYGVGGFAETVTDEQLHRQLDVNLFGVQRVMRAVLPAMRRQGKGLIINISSIMGRIVIPFAAAYTASKWALEGLSESYRYELAGTGVDVVLVEPGGFSTGFMDNMDNGADSARLESYGPLARIADEMWSNFAQKLAQKDTPDPRDVADAVLNLIQTPAGRRPLRTVVDPLMGGKAPETINNTSDKIQAMLFEDMGMKKILSVKPEA